MAVKTSARKSSAGKAPVEGNFSSQSSGFFASLVRKHKYDFLAAFFLVAGIFSAMAIHFNSVSDFGNHLESISGTLFGAGRFLIPSVFIMLGIILISLNNKVEEALDEEPNSNLRAQKIRSENHPIAVLTGSFMIGIAFLGIFHLTLGRPDFTDGTSQQFKSAGGILGAVFSIPIETIVGVVFAGIILGAVGIIGISIATRSNFKILLAHLARLFSLHNRGNQQIESELQISELQARQPQETGGFAPAPGIEANALSSNQSQTDSASPETQRFQKPHRESIFQKIGNWRARQRTHVNTALDPMLANGAASPASMGNGTVSENGLIPVERSNGVKQLAPEDTDIKGETIKGETDIKDETDTRDILEFEASNEESDSTQEPTLEEVLSENVFNNTSVGEPENVGEPESMVEKTESQLEKTPTPTANAKPKRKPATTAAAATAASPAAVKTNWKLPPLKLLTKSVKKQVKTGPLKENGQILEHALAAHGVITRVIGSVVGPTVTRYELELGEGIKVSKLTSLNKDIAYAMAAHDVRILAPIPGRQAIGIEVPNMDREIVLLGNMLNSPQALESSHPLMVPLGRDINGETVTMNIAETPHLLIAGATGAGKSSSLNSIVTSILMRSTPDQVRLILIDPKMVEMCQFENAPHLLSDPVVDPKKAANALGWAAREMDRRYNTLFRAGYRDIGGYNDAFLKGDLKTPEEPPQNTATQNTATQNTANGQNANGENREKTKAENTGFEYMPFIVIVVDELADLMMVAARDVEDYICRLAQKARAVGIHLVIATQRPSTDVITGVIKANVPARLAFSVSSLTDSRVILDQQGAERLVGQGDMLLRMPTAGSLVRIQGSWITEKEVKDIVKFWRAQSSEMDYVSDLTADTSSGSSRTSGGSGDSGDDELLELAQELVVNSGFGSTSMLQRKLRVGFARAGRLMDLLEERGIVGPSEGSKPREVLILPDSDTE